MPDVNDVVYEILTGANIRNGVSILNVNKLGTIVKDTTYMEANQTPSGLYDIYNNKFDDPTYYTS